jgi:hypothetical protein
MNLYTQAVSDERIANIKSGIEHNANEVGEDEDLNPEWLSQV